MTVSREPGVAPKAPEDTIRFKVLGAVEAVGNGQRLVLGGLKQRTVLSVLIAQLGRAVSVDRLVESTWGEVPPEGARRSLQTYVSNLRGVLGGLIVREGDGYRLETDRAGVDALRFEDQVAAAQTLMDEPETAAERLQDALAIWRGHPYEDVDGGTELQSEISRLNQLREIALESRIDADLAAGRHRQVVGELEALTEEHPLQERFRGQHMIALFRCGRQAEALRAYQKTRRYLGDELGIDPSSELRDLEQRILDQDDSLLGDAARSVVRRAVMIADIDSMSGLAELSPTDRQQVIDSYGASLDAAVTTESGTVFAHRGLATYASFDTTVAAVGAAETVQRNIDAIGLDGPGLRMAIDVGDVETTSDGEVAGPTVTRSRALVAAAWGGQILLSGKAQTDLSGSREGGWQVKALGSHPIQGLGDEMAIYQLVIPGVRDEFPALRREGMLPGLPRKVKTLPGYELRDVVGSGAFGVVHRAYQPSVGREVAVKVIRPDLANAPEFIRRFEVEAQLVARLEHPHIVPLYDYWRDPEGAYLVMRWLRGGSLQKRRQDAGPMSLEEAAELLAQLAPALEAAHRAGVIHGDVKPSNVLLDEEGNAYLSDFGIAFDIAADPRRSPEAPTAATDIAGLAQMLQDSLGDTIDTPIAAVLDRAVSPGTPESYLAMTDFVAAWDGAMSRLGVEASRTPFTPTRNPYKGLAAFQEGDARDFYGRDDLVEALVDAVGRDRLVAVVGPSGIGKSSAVRAGLIPALRAGAIAGSESWLISDMIPGPYPFESLASALLRISDRYATGIDEDLRSDRRGLIRAAQRLLPQGSNALLVVDQLEELFALSAESDAANRFLDALTELIHEPDANVRVVVTLRADFFDHPLRHSDFGKLLRDATVSVSAPTDEELAIIVRDPAENLGVSFESGLVDRIVADVSGQPSALPLVEFALTELFASRTTDTLTFDSYQQGGGVLGALGRRAETVYGGFDDVACETARQVMLRLVNVSESSDPTRQRVRRAELEHTDVTTATLDEVLSGFGDARLLTFDRDPATRGPTVEIAHESMFNQWERLAGWIDAHREDLILSRRVAAAVHDWEAADRDPTHLARAGRLAQFEAWSGATDLRLSTTETAFLQESRDAEDERIATRRRRRRLITSGFGIAALIALVLATAALVARNDSRDKAELARSRELAAAAITNLDRDPELSLLLALEASASSDLVGESRAALREALIKHRAILTYEFPADRVTRAVWGDISPDGKLLAVSTPFDGLVEVWSIDDDRLAWKFDLGSEYGATQPFFIDGGRNLVVPVYYTEGKPAPVGTAGIYILNGTTGSLVLMHEVGECGVIDAGFVGRSDAYVFATIPPCLLPEELGTVPEGTPTHRIDLATGEVTIATGGTDLPFRHYASEDESRVIRSSHSTTPMQVIDQATDLVVYTLSEPGPGDQVASISPAGDRVMFNASPSEAIEIRDITTDALVSRYHGHSSIWNAWFTADGETVFSSGPDGTFQLWDPDNGRTLLSIPFGDAVFWSAVTPDLSRAAVFSQTGTVKVFDLSDNVDPSRSIVSLEADCTVAQYASRSLHAVDNLATIDIICKEDENLGRTYVFDIRTGKVVMDYVAADGQGGEFSRDGRSLAVQPIEDGLSSAVAIYDTGSGDQLMQLEGLCPKDWFGDEQPTCAEFPETPFADTPRQFRFSPDGSQLAMVGANTGSLTVWDTDTGTMITTLGTDALSVDYHPDGSKLVVGMRDEIAVIDTTTWMPLAQWSALAQGIDPPADNVRYTPDGQTIVAMIDAFWGTADVHVLDPATLETQLLIPETHAGGANTIDVSADGELVATGGTDGFVRVWSLDSGALVTSIPGDSSADVKNLAFFDSDRRIMISQANRPLAILSIDDSELVGAGRRRATRGFTETECHRHQLDPCPTRSDIQAG